MAQPYYFWNHSGDIFRALKNRTFVKQNIKFKNPLIPRYSLQIFGVKNLTILMLLLQKINIKTLNVLVFGMEVQLAMALIKDIIFMV